MGQTMKIVLATGIYPPEIGGPATYVRALAEELAGRGEEVGVVTYGRAVSGERLAESFGIQYVPKCLPILRWFRYAKILRKVAKDADVVIAFSSVSVGVPLILWKMCWPLGFARGKPKLLLRLGGDFFWERYTARGGMKGLRDWYEQVCKLQVASCKLVMERILMTFDHIVFSTRFQEEIYEKAYKRLPVHSVIENAVPTGIGDKVGVGERHETFRLLFMGRMVGFKNLPSLIEAVGSMDGVMLSLVGDGPKRLSLTAHRSPLPNIKFLPPVHGEEKQRFFAEHDLLVIPSITEISPNVALEARAAGLPVLLTKETGLSDTLTQGMVVRDLITPEQIKGAIMEVMANYDQVAQAAAAEPPKRGWQEVANDWRNLYV